MAGINDFVSDNSQSTSESFLTLKVMNVEYTSSQYGTTVHVFGRTEDCTWKHVEIEGHSPSFFIRDKAYSKRVDNHYAVDYCETHDEDDERYTDLYGNPLVRVYTYEPDQVSDVHELFDWTGEADVFYTKRWRIDEDIYDGLRIDTSDAVTEDPYLDGDIRVENDAVEPRSREKLANVEPKKVAIDIEVASEDGVPDSDRAAYPVTTIVGWDSYSEQYVGWILHDETCEWEQSDLDRDESELDNLRYFEDESSMLHDFNKWVSDQQPDMITGWYSNDFDIPYLVNRSRDLNTFNVADWSPLGDVYLSRFDPVVKGVSCVDMLGAYEKTQIHNLTSKKLDDIAEKELMMDYHNIADTEGSERGVGKVDIDLSYTEMWRKKPTNFLKYNKVDVELVHQIDDEVGATDLLDNLRSVVGCSWTDPIGGNIDMMDVLFLRRAREYGYILPTAEEPEKDWYYGAKVFEPQAGISENVVYLDVASLYPSLIKQLNVGPETLVEEKPDCEHATAYIDTRPDNIKESSEPELSEVYYTMESRGFVASMVDELVEMKNEYKGTDMYSATKRITNSVYGVLSDATSYNRGFRLFDWRMGESICIAGRKVITECSELALEWCQKNGYEDAYIKMGDTDGFGVCLPSADGMDESLRAGYEMEKEINTNIPQRTADLFDMDEKDNEIEIECESYAERVFVKGENGGKSDSGVRKKYAQRLRWEK